MLERGVAHDRGEPDGMTDSDSFVDFGPGARGYLALPAGAGPHAAVLVYMEAFGLNTYVKDECDRLARLGYVALAPDFYRGDVFPYDDFSPIPKKIASIGDDGFVADIRAAIAYLDARDDVRHAAYGAIGFCMGGRLAFLTAAVFGTKIAGVVSLYGGGIAPDEPRFGRPPLAGRAPEIAANVLMIYGADDASIPPAEIARVTEALATAKNDAIVRVLPGAGHGFASTDRESYVPAAAEAAWGDAATFFERSFATRS